MFLCVRLFSKYILPGRREDFLISAFNFQELSQVREGRSATSFTDSKSDSLCLPMFYVSLCVKKNITKQKAKNK